MFNINMYFIRKDFLILITYNLGMQFRTKEMC